jgi:hypothetical protein
MDAPELVHLLNKTGKRLSLLNFNAEFIYYTYQVSYVKLPR